MRIAQVCPRYHPYIGGCETHVKEISERLIDKGFETEVLTTDTSRTLPREEVINDVRVKRFKSWAPNEAYYFSRELKKYLVNSSSSYNIVHAHDYHAFPSLYAAQTKSRNKLVFTPTYHGRGHTFFRNLLHVLYKSIARNIFKKADRVICVSNYEKCLVMDNFRVKAEKVSVVPNGLNMEEYKSFEKRRKDYRVILCVSRLERYKGIHYLIKSLPSLDENIHLEIVGKGPYEKSLLDLTCKLGIIDRVMFYQDLSRKELLQKYADADIFVSLSKYEAFGISVAEALASRTPCIVANASALKEWVDDKNCFAIDYPINIKKLAKLINVVMGKKVEGAKLLTWDEVVERLVKIYYVLLN